MEDPAAPPPPPSFGQKVRRLFAPILVGLAAMGKFLPFLKVGGTMIISMAVYAWAYGWKFGVGFVLLIFVHEMGHLIAARMMGLKVGLPVFIPFMGAVIALKEAPRNAWIESVVGIGGPLLGTLGAVGAASLYFVTGKQIFLALGYVGFFLNLFNLIPIVPLDGGRIVSAISPWLWVLGLVIIIPYMLLHLSGFSFIILLIVLTSIRRVFALFRPRSPAQMRYFECSFDQRICMAVLYFGLLGFLYVGMGVIRGWVPHGAL